MISGNDPACGLPAFVVELMEAGQVTPMTVPAGQVLLYAGHLPRGLFLVTAGAVEVLAKREIVAELRACQGLFSIPELSALNVASAFEFRVTESAEVLYLPRSLLLDQGTLAERLNERVVQHLPAAPE